LLMSHLVALSVYLLDFTVESRPAAATAPWPPTPST